MSDNHDHVSPEPLIDSKQVVTILTDCLFTEEELVEGVLSEDADAVIANGILFNYAFHPQRLESHREEVEQMLCNLPLAFRPLATRRASVGAQRSAPRRTRPRRSAKTYVRTS